MRRTASLPSSTVARERANTRPGRRSLVVAVSLLACFVAPALFAGSAKADSIDDKRAQAESIAQEIEENGTRISRLDEDLLEAQLRIAELEQQIESTSADVEQTRRAARSTDNSLARRAAELYMSGGSSNGLLGLEQDSFSDAGTRQVYLEVAADRDNDRLDQLRAWRKKLSEQVGALEAAQAQAQAEQERLDQARADLEAANARQEELLAQTQGELRELIAQEQARQAAAAEAAARAAAEQRQRDAAARANDTSTTTPPSDPDPDDDDDGGGGNNGGGGGPVVVAPNPRAQTAVDAAVAQLGTPYRFAQPGSWDDPDPDYFDCSGLTGWAWARAGYYLPHSSRAQFASLPHVDQDDLLPGDLVFYGSPIHHVGMYIGNGEYVHAPQTGDVVKISTIYRSDWAGAARIPG